MEWDIIDAIKQQQQNGIKNECLVIEDCSNGSRTMADDEATSHNEYTLFRLFKISFCIHN